MWLFALFLGVPLIEIALFIQVGGWIGLWPTLAIVIITALLGTVMVRQQGGQVLGQLNQAMSAARDPSRPIAEGAMILFSGALLLTPGFFTDVIGFALLLPPVRRALYAKLAAYVKVATPHPQRRAHHPNGPVIDGEFEDLSQQSATNAPHSSVSPKPSGWTRPAGAGTDEPK